MHFKSHNHSWASGTTVIPMIQMRKLQPRESHNSSKVKQPVGEETRIQTQTISLYNLGLLVCAKQSMNIE